MKVTMNLPDELLARADAYAKANYMNRTSLTCIALNQYLTAQQLPGLMANMNLAMQKIASTGEIDDDTRRTLDAFDLFVKSFRQE